jgi:hypothetical protein
MAIKEDNEKINAGLLKLDTLFERPKIAIDGVLHEITSPGELSIQDGYRLRVLADQLAKNRAADDLSEAQLSSLSATLGQMCEIILAPVPADVRHSLTDNHKLAVVEVFTMLLTADRLKVAAGAAVEMMNQWAGEKLSQGSSDIMAEARQAG